MQAMLDRRSNPLSNWRLPFALGISLTVIGSCVYRVLFPPIDARLVRVAKALDTEPSKVQQLRRLADAAGRKKNVTDKEFRELVQLFNDPNDNVRSYAISAMMPLGASERRGAILDMVRPLLNDPSKDPGPEVQRSAVILLWRFRDPDWRQEAYSRKDSSDGDLKQFAVALLSKGDFK